MSEIRVSSLYTYPIKGCQGIDVESSAVTPTGLKLDRNFVIVDGSGKFLSQRHHPQLASVVPSVEGDQLAVSVASDCVRVPLLAPGGSEEVPVDIWDKIGTGTYVDRDVDGMLSTFLGEEVRLLRFAQERLIDEAFRRDSGVNQTAFADGFPILLTSNSSLATLNQQQAGAGIPMDRFRPNIVLEGAKPNDETHWRRIKIGSLSAYVVRACARCPVPNVNQKTGEKDPAVSSVSRALGIAARGIDAVNGKKGTFFGQNLNHVYEPGVVPQVGDAVVVHERSQEPNILPIR